MLSKKSVLVLACLMPGVVFAGTAMAPTVGMPNEGSSETARTAMTGSRSFSGEGRAIAPPQAVPGEVPRSFHLDPAVRKRAFGTVGRMRSGEETRQPPSDELLRRLRTPRQDDRTMLRRDGDDPAIKEEQTTRSAVSGPQWQRVLNTEVFPFRVVGMIEAKSPSGEFGICSAALVGPRTVLTSAYCLFSNEKGWNEEFLFAPGADGFENMPMGAFEWDSAHIMEGFISQYDGTYDSIMIYDLGVLILKEPIGEQIGWLGFEAAPDGVSYRVNLAAFPLDRQPPGTMWHSNCDLAAAEAHVYLVEHHCSMEPGTYGGSLYVYDGQSGDRFIHGVHIAQYPDAGIALRLTEYDFAWIAQHWQ